MVVSLPLRAARQRGWPKLLLLVALTLAAYQAVWHAGFVWDDDAYVSANPLLRDAAGLRQIWTDVRATPQYYPLVHTSFWLEHTLWGLDPRGFHVNNVLLHALAALLLWRVLEALRLPGAWLAAAIFALHPVEVESVAWITERKNVLSTVFYLAAARAYLRFADPIRGRIGAWSWYGAALALFLAALLSKTVTCSLPAALLVVTWWQRGRLRATECLPLTPFFAAGAGLGLLTVWLERHHVLAQGADWALTFFERCVVAGRALWFYAATLLWPAKLSFIYPRWEIQGAVGWQWLFPLAALGAVVALWLARGRIGRGPVAAVLYFAGTLFPALGFIDVYPFRYSFVADHFQYLASIGPIALGAAGLARLPRPVPAVLLVVLGALTWQRAWVYRDIETLWRDTVAKNPESLLAHNNLGGELERQRRLPEALHHFTEAQRIAPDFPKAYYNMAKVQIAMGRVEEAAANYRRALELDPDDVDVLNGLGVALAMRGDHEGAAGLLDRALQLNPDHVGAHTNLGNLAYMRNQKQLAIDHYTRVIELRPDHAGVRLRLATVFEEEGRLAEAAAHHRELLRLFPTDASAHLRLARVLARLGLRAEALFEVNEALRLQPGNPEAARWLESLEAPAR